MKINPAMSAVTLANIIEYPRFEKFYGELYTGETHLAVRKYHEDPRLVSNTQLIPNDDRLIAEINDTYTDMQMVQYMLIIDPMTFTDELIHLAETKCTPMNIWTRRYGNTGAGRLFNFTTDIRVILRLFQPGRTHLTAMNDNNLVLGYQTNLM